MLTHLPNTQPRDGIIVQVIAVGPYLYRWAMRKGDDAPFLHSNGCFAKAEFAESNARGVVARANKKLAYVETISATATEAQL